MASMSDEETNNQSMPEKDCVTELRQIVLLNELLVLNNEKSDEKNEHLTGQPLAIASTTEDTEEGDSSWRKYSDFRPLVHSGLRMWRGLPTKEHDPNTLTEYLKWAFEYLEIKESDDSMVLVIDMFIDNVYEACVYRSQKHEEYYGSWRNLMQMIETTSLIASIGRYFKNQLHDELRIKRLSSDESESIFVDTVHAKTYLWRTRYTLVDWKIVETKAEPAEGLIWISPAISWTRWLG